MEPTELLRARIFAATCAGLMLGACTTPPAQQAAQDAEFAWGCWVSKEEPGGGATGFLRLLPDIPERTAYAGHLHTVKQNSMEPVATLRFAADGSRAMADVNGVRIDLPADPGASGPMADGAKRIMFGGTVGEDLAAIVVAGSPDRLILSIMHGGSTIVFDGERDGCD
jgi:hypothetical protein